MMFDTFVAIFYELQMGRTRPIYINFTISEVKYLLYQICDQCLGTYMCTWVFYIYLGFCSNNNFWYSYVMSMPMFFNFPTHHPYYILFHSYLSYPVILYSYVDILPILSLFSYFLFQLLLWLFGGGYGVFHGLGPGFIYLKMIFTLFVNVIRIWGMWSVFPVFQLLLIVLSRLFSSTPVE